MRGLLLTSKFVIRKIYFKNTSFPSFPGGAVVKNPPANAGDMGASPVREDPTCRGATKPMHHNYWACALEPKSHNYWARVPQLLKPVRLEPVLCNKPPQWEAWAAKRRVAPTTHNKDPMQPKINKQNKLKKKKKHLNPLCQKLSSMFIYIWLVFLLHPLYLLIQKCFLILLQDLFGSTS